MQKYKEFVDYTINLLSLYIQGIYYYEDKNN